MANPRSICDNIMAVFIITHLTLWHTLTAYFVVSPNGEESLNIFLCQNSGLSGGPSHMYNTSCVKEASQSKLQFFSYASGQTDRLTGPNALHLHPSMSAGIKCHIILVVPILML